MFSGSRGELSLHPSITSLRPPIQSLGTRLLQTTSTLQTGKPLSLINSQACTFHRFQCK